MNGENQYVIRDATSSGAWIPSRPHAPPIQLFILGFTDVMGGAARTAQHLNDVSKVRVIGRRYPTWLNFIAWPILILIPAGLIGLLLDETKIGLGMLFVGFLGIWIFGNLASLLGRQVTQIYGGN